MLAETAKRVPLVRRAFRAGRQLYWSARRSSLNQSHVEKALRAHGGKPRSVLVIGCNDGTECNLFLERGVERVVGVDPIDQIGFKYPDRRISYVRAGAEDLPLPDDEFELVFSFATLEHVHGLEAAYKEMARVLRPSGTVYTLAAPLWYSPYGHHCEDLFPDDPWIHLRASRDDIVAIADERGLTGEEKARFTARVDYMLDPRFFNRRHARDYIAASGSTGLDVKVQEMRTEPRGLLAGIEIDEPEDELLAATHRFVARKP